MKKIFYFLAVIFAALFITSCNNPKETVVNVHVQLEDGTPAAERIVFYTDDKAVYQKATDPSIDKEADWLPSKENYVISDAQGLAKVVLQLEKSKNMYFLVRHPRANMYNSASTFVFKGTVTDLDLKIGE